MTTTTLTYRGVRYEAPSREQEQREFKYHRQNYIQRLEHSEREMTYRGINHELLDNIAT